MGDSRIFLHVSRRLIASITEQVDDPFVIIKKKLAADSSVRELFEDTYVDDKGRCSLLSLLIKHAATSVWDCTTSPPKNISDWPLTTYSDKKGLKSRTLYDAGWFPSARIVVAAEGVDVMDALGSSDKYDDHQYSRLPSETKNESNRSRVQLAGKLPDDKATLPSQVMASVAKRFEDVDRDSETAKMVAQKHREHNKLQEAIRLHERYRKIDDKIRRLEEQVNHGRNKGVSKQVQKMLIKSRATGRRELATQNRRYFRCLVLADDNATGESNEEYRYFSNQDTIGRILSTFHPPEGKISELLIRVTKDRDRNIFEYYRIPVLMRVYEAIERDYFAEFERILIRMYDPQTGGDPTTSIEDTEPAVDEFRAGVAESTEEWKGNDENDTSGAGEASRDDTPCMVFESLSMRLAEFDKSSGVRPASAAIAKVKQMQMKSKAKGDAKRVKQESRFFVELVTAVQDDTDVAITLAPVFLASTDPLERLATDCSTIPSFSGWDCQFLVPVARGSFRVVADTKMRFCDAEQRGIVKCFDRIILLYTPRMKQMSR